MPVSLSGFFLHQPAKDTEGRGRVVERTFVGGGVGWGNVWVHQCDVWVTTYYLLPAPWTEAWWVNRQRMGWTLHVLFFIFVS